MYIPLNTTTWCIYLSILLLDVHTSPYYYLMNIPLNTTTWCTYLSILLLQIVDNCTECGSALRSTRVTQDRGRWIRPTSQHGRPLLLNALHFHQQYPHLDPDPKGLLNNFKSDQDEWALQKPRMQFGFSSKPGAPRYHNWIYHKANLNFRHMPLDICLLMSEVNESFRCVSIGSWEYCEH